MSRRAVLTNRQRASLFGLPTEEATLLRHYILTDEDLAHVRRRRRPQNRIGFALQLCALRYPGRLLQPGETIPERMLAFIGAQLGLSGEALIDYGVREATRYQHSAALQRIYGYRQGQRMKITQRSGGAYRHRSKPLSCVGRGCWCGLPDPRRGD